MAAISDTKDINLIAEGLPVPSWKNFSRKFTLNITQKKIDKGVNIIMLVKMKYVFVLLFLPIVLWGNPAFNIRFETGETKDYILLDYMDFANNLSPDPLFLQMSIDNGETWHYISVIYDHPHDPPYRWVGVIPIEKITVGQEAIHFKITTKPPDEGLGMP